MVGSAAVLAWRLNIFEEDIAIDYALKSSSNIGDDFGGVSHGTGSDTDDHRREFQQFNRGANDDAGNHAHASGNSGSNARCHSGGADARAGNSSGSSGGSPDMVGGSD